MIYHFPYTLRTNHYKNIYKYIVLLGASTGWAPLCLKPGFTPVLILPLVQPYSAFLHLQFNHQNIMQRRLRAFMLDCLHAVTNMNIMDGMAVI